MNRFISYLLITMLISSVVTYAVPTPEEVYDGIPKELEFLFDGHTFKSEENLDGGRRMAEIPNVTNKKIGFD
jgi:hypothetical protein